MTKEEFLEKFTGNKSGKLKLPYGFAMNEPYGQKTGTIGIYQKEDKTWRVYKIGLPDPYGSGEAYQACTLFQGHNADKAFSIFYNFIIGKENADYWIMDNKVEYDD